VMSITQCRSAKRRVYALGATRPGRETGPPSLAGAEFRGFFEGSKLVRPLRGIQPLRERGNRTLVANSESCRNRDELRPSHQAFVALQIDSHSEARFGSMNRPFGQVRDGSAYVQVNRPWNTAKLPLTSSTRPRLRRVHKARSGSGWRLPPLPSKDAMRRQRNVRHASAALYPQSGVSDASTA
jgi:hypothetical protein